ncbi:heavy metal translocating P-type ATPase [Paludibaculum fermentans]|uniref:heavy metal translocating P-type ATPase n=1 Tax=Paludibaculum fermentans TaxID=1473598 RepID=UPI003EBE0722
MNCDLCGLPAGPQPLSLQVAGTHRAFCCQGCLNVYTILAESGVIARGEDFRSSEVYRESLRLGLISNSQAARVEIPEGAETRESTYQLSGLWCSSCGWLIEHALASEHGIVSANVLFASDLLKVRYCPQYLPPGRITSRVQALGYNASEYSGETDRDRGEKRDLLLRIGIAAFLWMNVMLLSLVIYASYWENISDAARRIVPLALAGLTLPAVFYSAWPILRVAFLGLRAFTLRMEALLALGILAAFGYSCAQAVAGGRHFYFDTACAIITLVLLGKLLERGAKERTTQAITALYRMMPSKARIFNEGRESFVSIEALQPGSLFVVKAGERIPADGTVVDGESDVDESILTGESAPRPKTPGVNVIAGSLNGGSVLRIRALRTAGDSTLHHIIRSVEQAMASRAPIERTVDKVARVFVPVTIAIALMTLTGWLLAGATLSDALMRAIAVLVIACPCALGIATPLAITAAVGAASRRGILIRDAAVLEQIGNIDVLVLDKTGTVTEGDFNVLDCLPANLPFGPLAALETLSEHPLARAVVRRAGPAPLPTATQVQVHKGHGISGQVHGQALSIGNRALIASQCIPDVLNHFAQHWEATGATVAFVSENNQVTAAIAFGDRIRADARETLLNLQQHNIATLLLSGDAVETTQWVASAIGAGSFRGAVLPDGKKALIDEMKAQGRKVAMIGDGVNDAPALAAADLGIALGSGADLAMQAAPVVLMSNSLAHLSVVFEIARATLRVVRQNLFWAFFYNAAGITLAITGVLNPILAAAAMVLSSLCVIGNSFRLRNAIAHD